MRFDLGQVIVTPKATQALENWGRRLEELLDRHRAADWGDVSDELRDLNNEAVSGEQNLVSVYHTPDGQAITVFTKADRSATLVHIGPK